MCVARCVWWIGCECVGWSCELQDSADVVCVLQDCAMFFVCYTEVCVLLMLFVWQDYADICVAGLY